MSGDQAAMAGTGSRITPVLRYACGSAIIMLVSQASGYTLAYLTPVLALNFLAPDSPGLTTRGGLTFLVVVSLTSIAGILFSRLFLDYPLVFLPLLGLILFRLYYLDHLHKVKLWLILSLLLIPMISMESPGLGSIVAMNLVMNALLTVLMVWVVYFIFPAAESPGMAVGGRQQTALTERQRYIAARNTSIVVLPVMVLFFVFNLSDSLLILVFIAILSMNPATTGKKAGIVLILANFMGGLAAILAFNLLTVAPYFPLLGLLTLGTGLLFGGYFFRMEPLSPMYGMAFSTFLLILGNVTTTEGEAGKEVWMRILQLSVVVIYVVTAFGLVNKFSHSRQQSLS